VLIASKRLHADNTFKMDSEHTATKLSTPLEVGRKTFAVALAAVWLAVAATQIVVFARSQISVRDACGTYLPMARAAAEGDWARAQSAMFPPVYPVAAGLLSRTMKFAEYPEELAGKVINAASLHVVLICVLVICLKLWSRRVALLAVGFVGLNPRLMQMSVNVWLEPLYAANLALCTLILVLSRDRLKFRHVVLLGLGAAAAPLIRGEGIVLTPAIAVCLLVCHARWSIKALLKLSGWCLLGTAVVAAMWGPRIKYVYDLTGLPLLDIRAASIISAENRVPEKLWRSSPLDVDQPGQTLSSIPRSTWRRPGDSLARWLGNNVQALVEAWNPVVVVFALLGLIWRRGLRRYGRLEAAMGVLILMQLVGTAVAHDWQRRYVSVVAPHVAIFGAVGLIASIERVRSWALAAGKSAWWVRWSGNIPTQLAMLAMLFGVCAGFSIRRAQRRHSELRYAGEFIQKRFGPGRRIMVRTPEPAYYARGRQVGIPEWRSTKLSNRQLAAALRESRADLLLLSVRHLREHKSHGWCPEFYQRCRAGAYASAVIEIPLQENSDEIVLFDARRLVPLLHAEAGAAGS